MEIRTVNDVSPLQRKITALEPFAHLIEIRRDSRNAKIKFFYNETTASELVALFAASSGAADQTHQTSHQQVSAGQLSPSSRSHPLLMRLALVSAITPEEDGYGQEQPATKGRELRDAWNVCDRILEFMNIERTPPADAVKHTVFPPRASSMPDGHYLATCVRYSLTINTCEVCWAFDTSGIVYAVIRFWNPHIARLVSATIKDLWHHKDFAGHPMLLPTLALFHVAPEMRWWLDKHISGVVTGMMETGFHYNVDLREQIPLDAQELGRRSAVLSGHASNLATNKHCWEGLQNLAVTVIEECGRIQRPAHSVLNPDEWKAAHDYITHHASCCSRHSTTVIQEVDSWQQKAAIQIQAFFSLIAQRDATQSLELANASKIIAEESKRDSTSMKAIAAVTMFFLPGTFLASLFAMPIFDWNATQGQSVVNSRIWVYFAFAGPITLITVCSWFMFNHIVGKSEARAKVGEHNVTARMMRAVIAPATIRKKALPARM